jgi:hypothetical protein
MLSNLVMSNKVGEQMQNNIKLSRDSFKDYLEDIGHKLIY